MSIAHGFVYISLSNCSAIFQNKQVVFGLVVLNKYYQTTAREQHALTERER